MHISGAITAMAEGDKTILLVEDWEDDELLFKIVLRRAGFTNRISVVRDGDEAIAYLEGRGNYADRGKYPMPEMLILDIKLPRKTGLEVLEWLRGHPQLKHLPVAVLTGSILPSDRQRAEELGANWFLQKPCEVETLNSVADNAPHLWVRRTEGEKGR